MCCVASMAKLQSAKAPPVAAAAEEEGGEGEGVVLALALDVELLG